MKRWIVLCLLLCLAVPLGAQAAEKLPRVSFPEKNYLGYIGYDLWIKPEVKNGGSFTGTKVIQLRDETGRVWAEKEVKNSVSSLNFKIAVNESLEGGADLSVWCDDTQISYNTAYIAVTDRHRKVIQTVATDEPYMSISFDCAYVDAPTDALLAILDEMNVKATFFMTGYFVQTFTESAQKIRDAGHEIACHSLSHPHMLEKPLDVRFNQVRKGAALIREYLGVNPRLFRPPFGEFDVTVSAPARAEGMEVCMWTIDSHDWDSSFDADKVYRRVTKNITPGTIILFHLDGFDTLEVAPKAIDYYRSTMGLELVTISELVQISGRKLPACPYED